MDARVADELERVRPARLVYVSCDPATFARDVNRMVKKGYEMKICQPLDMFPQTMHVEVVALLEKEYPSV